MMPRMRGKAVGTLGLAVVTALLCIPSLAVADVVDDYRYLFNDHLSPTPLAPTSLPAAVGSFNDVGLTRTAKGKNWYMDFVRVVNKRIQAELILNSAGPRSLSKTKRKLRKRYRARKTTVRGRPALAFKRRKGQGKFLAWVEDGILYEVATSTPKTISDNDLNTTAAGLEHLLGVSFGQTQDPGSTSASSTVFVFDRHVLLGLNWSAPCFAPGETFPSETPYSGANLMVPLSAGGFSVGPTVTSAFNSGPNEPKSWAVSASGTASTAGGQITVQAAGDAGNTHCSIGPVDVSLQPV